MKILHVTNFFKPSWEAGGVARVAYEISENLVNEGHEVTVYTTDGFKSRLNVEKNTPIIIDGMKIYYFRNLLNYLTKSNLPIPYYVPLIARSQMQDFDIIHIHEHRTFLAIIVHFYAKKYRTPYILQSHGSVTPFFKKKTFKILFDHFFGYKILRDASKVIALTKTEANQYEMMGVSKNKIEIIPNGINLSEYNNLPKKGKFKTKYMIPMSNKVILYLGRLHESKGLDLILDSFSDVHKELHNIKLVFVGPDDGYQESLTARAKKLDVSDNIIFAGYVDNITKIEAFVDATVFITPSYSGFPVTFLEACACGTPIITTTNGDILEWINDKVGYVVEYDKDQLKNAMFRILSDENLRAKFKIECSNLMVNDFEWAKIVKKLENLYRINRRIST